MESGLLLSLKIERRIIAVAVYRGPQLEHLQERSLSHLEADALKGATGFLAWVLDSFPITTAAVEAGAESITRRAAVVQAVRGSLRAAAIPIWEVSRAQLLEAYGEPPCRTLGEVRRTAVTLWPFLGSDQDRPALIDAAALGAFVQMQRLLAAARVKEAHGRVD